MRGKEEERNKKNVEYALVTTKLRGPENRFVLSATALKVVLCAAVGIMNPFEQSDSVITDSATTRRTPQGVTLGPLLFSVYAHRQFSHESK